MNDHAIDKPHGNKPCGPFCACCLTPGCRRKRVKGVFRCWFCLRLIGRRHQAAMKLAPPERLEALQRAIVHLDAQHRQFSRN